MKLSNLVKKLSKVELYFLYNNLLNISLAVEMGADYKTIVQHFARNKKSVQKKIYAKLLQLNKDQIDQLIGALSVNI